MDTKKVKSEIKEFLEKYRCYGVMTLSELKSLKVEDLKAGQIHVLSYMVGKYQGCTFDEIYYIIYDLIAEEYEHQKRLAEEIYGGNEYGQTKIRG